MPPTRRKLAAFFSASLLALPACASHRGDCEPSYAGAQRIRVASVHFDDGDTFDYKGETIRVLGVDTPEVAHVELGWEQGQPYGDVAAESTRVWMSRAQCVEYVRDGQDRYDRRLAHVFVDGKLLAVMLLEAGLAYETVSHYGDSGFPDLAQEILDTSRTAPKQQFEPPHRWKSKQRRKNKG